MKYALLVIIASISFSIVGSPVNKPKDKVQKYEDHKKDRKIKEQRKKAIARTEWSTNPNALKKQAR